MERFDDSRGQKIFKGHHSRDRQKGVCGRRSLHKWTTVAFEVKYEVIKPVAYMQCQKKKDGLHGVSKISDALAGFTHIVIIIYSRRSGGMTSVMFSGPLPSEGGILLIFSIFLLPSDIIIIDKDCSCSQEETIFPLILVPKAFGTPRHFLHPPMGNAGG